jgi:polyisoprenoid-binding protein YceI
MKKVTILGGLMFAMFSFAPSEMKTWSIDNAHSYVGFSINHLGISDVQGNFNTYEAKVSATKEDFSDAKFEFSAEVASINTHNAMRDEHLKKEDMLDATKFPKISFVSSSVMKNKDNSLKLTGDLTLHGITKKVELTAVHTGNIVHPMYKKNMAGFKIHGSVKRSDFSIAKEMPAPMLSEDITINVNTEFAQN